MPLSHHLSLDNDSILGDGAGSDKIISYRTPNALNSDPITTEITSGYVLRFASIQSSDSNAVIDAFDDLNITSGSWYEISGRITIRDNSTDDKNMTAYLFRNNDFIPVKQWYYHFTQGDTSNRYFVMVLNGYIYLDTNKSYKWFVTGNSGFIEVSQTEIYMKKLNTTHPS
jgi:hypothetical protein